MRRIDEQPLHERQPDEGARAWEAFCCYRDMGPKRSITKVAQKLGKSGSIISRWSSQHGWKERVAAWQKEEDACAEAVRRELVRRATRRHLALANSMFATLRKCLKSTNLSNELSPKDFAVWARAAVQIERDALGLVRAAASSVQQEAAPSVTFTRDPTGCIPDHILDHARASVTHDEALAAAHAILRIRREKARPSVESSDQGQEAEEGEEPDF